jgi:peptide/nickel transport system substrate-binding protein
VVALVASGIAALAATAASSKASGKAKQTSLTFLVGEGFTTDLDPDGLPTVAQGQINTNVYDKYFWYPTTNVKGALVANYRGSVLQLVPHLVQSYTHKGNVWTFTLRKGVKGCTGDELTADDAVYTYARVKSRTGLSNAMFSGYSTAGIFSPTDTSKTLNGEIAKVSKYTFRVTTVQPSQLMPRLFADAGYGMIFDSKLMQQHATPDDPWSHKWLSAGNAAGYGPYCIASVDTTAQQYVLRANPGWYGPKPQFQTVTIRSVPDPASRFAAVQSGQADGTNDLAPDQYASLAKSNSVYTVFDSGIIRMTLNFKLAPWSLPGNGYLRRAVQAAMPYDAILKTLYGAATSIQGPFAPTWTGAVTFPQPKTNIPLAKKLLAEAGFPDGQGLDKYKDGLTLSYNSGNAWAPAVANQIQTGLAAIGINITVQPLAPPVFNGQSNGGNLPMFFSGGNPGNYPEVSAGAAIFYRSRAAGGVANGSNYNNPDLDATIVAMGSATGDQYKKLAVKLQKYLWGDLPVVPIAVFANQAVFKKGITGFLSRPQNPFVSFWPLHT